MTTIYVVTEGDYSSYRIVAPFTDRALAEKFCATWDDVAGVVGDKYRIEEFEADPTHPPVVGVLHAEFIVDDDGSVVPKPDHWSVPRLYAAYADDGPFTRTYVGKGYKSPPCSRPAYVSVDCLPEQDPHKIACDAWAQHLAEEAGIA